MDKKLQERLIRKAAEAAEKSYAPHSKFYVGAALLVAGENRVISGCNVENASYGLTVCAERVALVTAVAAGFRRFKAMAICAKDGGKTVPCGACLQVLAEFCEPNFVIILGNADSLEALQVYQLRDLLPHVFGVRK